MAKNNAYKHPVTGCRADTIFGVWLHDEHQLVMMVDAAWAVIEAGELQVVSDRSRAMNEERPDPYVRDSGMARILISGPLTKHATSMSSLFGGTAMTEVRDALRQVREDNSVRGVFIEADSWGGTAEGTAELAEAIRKTDKVKPVFVHAEDKATSGMLWLATQGRRFTASPGASVGSQGTILSLVDASDRVRGTGVKPVVIKTGKYKDMGNPSQPIGAETIAELQRFVNSVNKPFHDQVVSARRLTPEQDKDVSTARIYVGEDAKRIGLIDEVCHADEAFENAVRTLEAGTAKRGPVPVTSITAVPKGTGGRMALTAQQIERVRAEIPGAAQVKDEDLDSFLAESAISLKQEVKNKDQDLAAAKAQVAVRDEKIVTISAQVPKKMDPELLAGKVENFMERVSIAVDKGAILQSQADILRGALLGADGKPTAIAEQFLTANGGVAVSSVFQKVIELNKPNGLTTQLTGAQPAPKQEPGSKGNEEKPFTYEGYCKVAIENGLPPVPRAEWEARKVQA